MYATIKCVCIAIIFISILGKLYVNGRQFKAYKSFKGALSFNLDQLHPRYNKDSPHYLSIYCIDTQIYTFVIMKNILVYYNTSL